LPSRPLRPITSGLHSGDDLVVGDVRQLIETGAAIDALHLSAPRFRHGASSRGSRDAAVNVDVAALRAALAQLPAAVRLADSVQGESSR
jgi:hypothetical protein